MRGKIFYIILLAFAVVHAAGPAQAVLPDEVLADPVLEIRARTLSAQLRCLVCQNETIDESTVPLARDLRLLVRERLVAGDSDRQVLDFLVARYGDFILLKPRLSARTMLLWFAPLLIFLGAAGWLVVVARRNSGGLAVSPLTAEEENRLARLLEDERKQD
ncbi:MAG: Cytochrome c-type biogenesis protein CcmH [Candidatus Tokpelaia hoelldobleri]|uniref:Cytochrome c-type biogenesis protein n=1 Tax=Candidatus Tokpelaia hoelldobleri TaxID=1902579 RepID=A0A1U9JW03_9HYPH|nr:MAG: Cytochrome c-type biogenesis protein CcmH [Candidatus Tokpelaia hoelldoblerii]